MRHVCTFAWLYCHTRASLWLIWKPSVLDWASFASSLPFTCITALLWQSVCSVKSKTCVESASIRQEMGTLSESKRQLEGSQRKLSLRLKNHQRTNQKRCVQLSETCSSITTLSHSSANQKKIAIAVLAMIVIKSRSILNMSSLLSRLSLKKSSRYKRRLSNSKSSWLSQKLKKLSSGWK